MQERVDDASRTQACIRFDQLRIFQNPLSNPDSQSDRSHDNCLSMNAPMEHIVIDPAICHGRPVIRGTRMPVSLVVGSLAGGMSFEEVEKEYGLTREDVRAALRFAGRLVEEESFHLLPA
jgi:uncharacterized protein (DUF433 family)